MPKNQSKNLPEYRCNKTTGRASVSLGGRVHWLGKHGTRESKEKYHRIVSEYLATGTVAPKDGKVIVADLILAYWKHCETYYRKPDGEATNEATTIKGMLSVVRKLYGHVPAEQFGPVALAGCREAMIRRGRTRKSINLQVCRVRARFKWCASVEMIPGTVHGALQTLLSLKAGRCKAKEPEFRADSRSFPERVLMRHASNELANLGVNHWSSRRLGPRLPSPIEFEALLVSTDDRLGLHDE